MPLNNNTELNLCICCDTNYLIGANACIKSFLKHHKTKSYDPVVNIWILTVGDINISQKSEIADISYDYKDVNITFIDITEKLNYYLDLKGYIKPKTWITKASFGRLIIQHILPESVKKCFYLDADIIVLDNLQEAYNSIDTNSNKLLASVPDHGISFGKVSLKEYENLPEFKKFFDNKCLYFNSGFLVLNLDALRKENTIKEYREFLIKYPKPRYDDQDTLNACTILKNPEKVKLLTLNYNTFVLFTDKNDMVSNSKPKILHYVTPIKPWHKDYKNEYYKALWNSYYYYKPKPNKEIETDLNIVYCVDDNKQYLNMLRMSIDSIFKYNPNANITICSENNINISINNCNFFKLNIPKQFFDIPIIKKNLTNRFGRAAYYRLFLSQLPYKKVLYLDCDILCRHSLNRLFNKKIDLFGMTETVKSAQLQKPSLPFKHHYASGVMLMNLEKLRNYNILNLIKNANFNKHVHWCNDESIIHELFYDQITPLTKNDHYYINNIPSAIYRGSNAVLWHYDGVEKIKAQFKKDYDKNILLDKLKTNFNAKCKIPYLIGDDYCPIMRSAFPTYTRNIHTTDKIVKWCDKWSEQELNNVILKNCEIDTMEDAFLRSIYPANATSEPGSYKTSIAYTIGKYMHYDAKHISDLEKLINNPNNIISEEQKNRAKSCIDFIIKNKLSKYNCQFDENLQLPNNNKSNILLIDQVFTDSSVLLSNANHDTFKRMYYDAVSENPNSNIIIKTHPENSLGLRKGFYTNKPIKSVNIKDLVYPYDSQNQLYIPENENVYFFDKAINPISLLLNVDKIYVVGSQMGFEALMCKKPVITYGDSFYAGYGLTEDRNNHPFSILYRRNIKRSLEELFYIAYIQYSHYIHPKTNKHIRIEDALDYLYQLKSKIFSDIRSSKPHSNVIMPEFKHIFRPIICNRVGLFQNQKINKKHNKWLHTSSNKINPKTIVF